MEKSIILIVEDDEICALIAMEFLAPLYQTYHVQNAGAAFAFLETQTPSLVLLDVILPDISGYEICRKIRQTDHLTELPIIFLSAKTTEQERLLGYEAGGNDYLTKPIAGKELRIKIALSLQTNAERIRLKADLANTFSTAMTAMTSAAEIGVVLNFLRNSFYCQDYQALCLEVLNTMSAYDLEGCVQIRGKLGITSLSTDGPCSPLEESVLSYLFGHDRLFQFSSFMSCSYEFITIVTKQLDRSDPERVGRIRDNIAMLAEGANVRIIALDANADLHLKQQVLTRMIETTANALTEIGQQQHTHRLESDQLFQDLQLSFEQRMMSMGLTEAQEEELASLVHKTGERALRLYDQSASTENYMHAILENLNHFHP